MLIAALIATELDHSRLPVGRLQADTQTQRAAQLLRDYDSEVQALLDGRPQEEAGEEGVVNLREEAKSTAESVQSTTRESTEAVQGQATSSKPHAAG